MEGEDHHRHYDDDGPTAESNASPLSSSFSGQERDDDTTGGQLHSRVWELVLRQPGALSTFVVAALLTAWLLAPPPSASRRIRFFRVVPVAVSKWVRFYRFRVHGKLVLAWCLTRLTPAQPSESLLQLLLRYADACRTWTVRQVPLLPPIRYLTEVLPEFVSSRIEFLLTDWVWRVVGDVAAVLLLGSMLRIAYDLYYRTTKEWVDLCVSSLFEWAKSNVPGIQEALDKQTDEFSSTTDSVLNKDKNRALTLAIPEQGRPDDAIVRELKASAVSENQKWMDGKVSGTVYSNDKQHTELLCQVYKLYAWGNPLHPGFWPKLNQCEAEVIAMTSRLLNNPEPIGCLTSGGTESIVLAVRAHLRYYGTRRNIRYPEIIAGTSAHAALNKACDMFGIRLVAVDCDDAKREYQLDPARVRNRLTSNTIMIYASAPSYPQGVVDPIGELSQIASRHDIGLHVDACLGGFFLPFLDRNEDNANDTQQIPPVPGTLKCSRWCCGVLCLYTVYCSLTSGFLCRVHSLKSSIFDTRELPACPPIRTSTGTRRKGRASSCTGTSRCGTRSTLATRTGRAGCTRRRPYPDRGPGRWACARGPPL